MPRLRHHAGAGPPPKSSLPPPPPTLKTERAQLIWRIKDITMEEESQWQLHRQRSSIIEPEFTPPPTPSMRKSEPATQLALDQSETLDQITGNAPIIPESEREDWRRGLQEERERANSHRGRERQREAALSSASQSAASSSTSSSGRRGAEFVPESRRRSRSQDDERTVIEKEILKAHEHAKRIREQDGGVSLKPLTPLQPTPVAPSRKPVVARKRASSVAKLNTEEINQLYREEPEYMSEDPVIRQYARTSQEELYGPYGMSDAYNAPMMQRYPEPNRDMDEINRSLYNMTVHDHDYRAGGPPGSVDYYNIDWDTDVSEVQGRAEFEDAREAKAFAAYTMYTDREAEIYMMHRMKAHGYLKEGIEIKYGYQEMGPRGSIAWLTKEGQEVGWRMRKEYERAKAYEEARKQAQVEHEYYMTFDPSEFDQRHDSKVSASSPDIPAPEPVSHSANSTLRAPSPVEDLNTLIARIATKRRGSDDSLKTAYTVDEIIPESAYRSRPDLRPDLASQHPSITASAPTDNSSDEEDLIATFTDY